MASQLKNRRKIIAGLTIQTPSINVTGPECQALHAKYDVSDEIIGQGTTAVVKRGTQKQSGTPVAVKEIKTYGDEELCEIVRKEFEVMKSLRHPNIVKVYDLYLAPNMTKAYLCLDLVQGATLQGVVEKHGKIDEVTMRCLFEQLASALSYLHCKRITHRDLKPDNLLVHKNMDKLYICDFNCARKLADGSALTNRVGAMAFAPPEMLLGKGILGEQTDIWSAGVCLYFALSGGRTPTQGKSFRDQKSFGQYLANASLTERQEWIKAIGLSKESLVAQVLWACMHPDASQRPDAMLLLAHPWVSPTEDIAENPDPINVKRSSSGLFNFSPQSRKSSSMASRSQRLCAHGLGAGGTEKLQDCGGTEQVEHQLSDRSEDSTVASPAEIKSPHYEIPRNSLNVVWNSVPCMEAALLDDVEEEDDDVFTPCPSPVKGRASLGSPVKGRASLPCSPMKKNELAPVKCFARQTTIE